MDERYNATTVIKIGDFTIYILTSWAPGLVWTCVGMLWWGGTWSGSASDAEIMDNLLITSLILCIYAEDWY